MASQRYRTEGYRQTAIRSSCAAATFPVSTVSEATCKLLLLPGTPSGHTSWNTSGNTSRSTTRSTSRSTTRRARQAPAGGKGRGTGVPYHPLPPPLHPWYHPYHPGYPPATCSPSGRSHRGAAPTWAVLRARWGSVSDPPGAGLLTS